MKTKTNQQKKPVRYEWCPGGMEKRYRGPVAKDAPQQPRPKKIRCSVCGKQMFAKTLDFEPMAPRHGEYHYVVPYHKRRV